MFMEFKVASPPAFKNMFTPLIHGWEDWKTT